MTSNNFIQPNSLKRNYSEADVEKVKEQYILLTEKYSHALDTAEDSIYQEIYSNVCQELIKAQKEIKFYEKEIKHLINKMRGIRASSLIKYRFFHLFFGYAKDATPIGENVKFNNTGFMGKVNSFFKFVAEKGNGSSGGESRQMSDHRIFQNIQEIVSVTKELDELLAMEKKISFFKTKYLTIYDIINLPWTDNFKNSVLQKSQRITAKENDNHAERVKGTIGVESLLFKGIFLSFMKSPIQSEDIHKKYEFILSQMETYTHKLEYYIGSISEFEKAIEDKLEEYRVYKSKENYFNPEEHPEGIKIDKINSSNKESSQEINKESLKDDDGTFNNSEFLEPSSEMETEEEISFSNYSEEELNEDGNLDIGRGKFKDLNKDKIDRIKDLMVDLISSGYFRGNSDRGDTIYKNRFIKYFLNRPKTGQNFDLVEKYLSNIDSGFYKSNPFYKSWCATSKNLVNNLVEIKFTKEEIEEFFRIKINGKRAKDFIKNNKNSTDSMNLQELVDNIH